MAFIPPNALNANILPGTAPLQSYPSPTMSPGPTLLPRPGQMLVLPTGMLKTMTPFDMVKNLPSRTGAVGSFTIGGTIAATDVNTVTFTSGLFNGGSFSVVSNNAGGDTTGALGAQRMALNLNANATLQAWGFVARDRKSV